MPTDHLGWLTWGFGIMVVAYFVLSFRLYVISEEINELRKRNDRAWGNIQQMIREEIISVEIRLVGLMKKTNSQKLGDYLENMRKRFFREPFL